MGYDDEEEDESEAQIPSSSSGSRISQVSMQQLLQFILRNRGQEADEEEEDGEEEHA